MIFDNLFKKYKDEIYALHLIDEYEIIFRQDPTYSEISYLEIYYVGQTKNSYIKNIIARIEFWQNSNKTILFLESSNIYFYNDEFLLDFFKKHPKLFEWVIWSL